MTIGLLSANVRVEGTTRLADRVDETQLFAYLRSLLTADEIARGALYFHDGIVAAGVTMRFGPLALTTPWEAYVTFIDREPIANWGHSARCVMMRLDPPESISIEVRFPPFGDPAHSWRVVHPAPSAP